MLGGFVDVVVAGNLTNGVGTTGAAVAAAVDVPVDVDVFGFSFGAFSLRTRTDAGTIEVRLRGMLSQGPLDNSRHS